jgi:hypothetical protein
MNPLRLALSALLVSCARAPMAPSCPAGFTEDPGRSQHIALRLAEAAVGEGVSLANKACFGPSASLGVLAGGRPLLSSCASDEVLAARLAHLELHVRDNLGDGCNAGLEQAIASEARARKLEAAVRTHFGLPLEFDEPADSIVDYKVRCAR